MRDNFALIGVSEYFDETLVLLRRKGFISSTEYVNAKVITDRPTIDEVDPKVIEYIEAHCKVRERERERERREKGERERERRERKRERER